MKKFVNVSLLTLLFAAIFSACDRNPVQYPQTDKEKDYISAFGRAYALLVLGEEIHPRGRVPAQ